MLKVTKRLFQSWKVARNTVLSVWFLILVVKKFPRPLDDVLAEIAGLAEKGVREISLLGQNVNGYRGETFEGEICTFADLLRLVAEIPGIGRLRYTTSHPLEFNEDLIQC